MSLIENQNLRRPQELNRISTKNYEFVKDIARGHQFQKKAIPDFEKVSKCNPSKYYLIHHMRYGSSQDALGPAGILLEVKTRAENCSGPLEFQDKFSQYFAQCQLQVSCSNAEFCILQSYHPET